MTLILGIDPGSHVTGYGIINVVDNQNEYVASGCIRIKATSLSERLKIIFDGVNEIILRYQPQQMAIEQVFMATNPGGALKLGQARGAAIVAAVNQQLSVTEYSARQVKQAVVGKGAAEKWQVQHMVVSLLNLNKKPSQDAADALAIAICHAHTDQGKIKQAKSLVIS